MLGNMNESRYHARGLAIFSKLFNITNSKLYYFVEVRAPIGLTRGDLGKKISGDLRIGNRIVQFFVLPF